jgi:hypothetical protein
MWAAVRLARAGRDPYIPLAIGIAFATLIRTMFDEDHATVPVSGGLKARREIIGAERTVGSIGHFQRIYTSGITTARIYE